MNKRFPILSVISAILIILGWVIFLGGLYLALYEGIIEPNQEGHGFSGGDMLQFLQGIGLLLAGLIVTSFGELIKVFFAIEENTRKQAQYCG